MASLNRVFLMGNLTRDPEVRYAPSGKAVAEMRMAMNRKYRTSSGEEKDETCYVNVVVWGRQAETCAQYLAKGSPCFVEGRLQYDEWEKDGQKNNRLRVVADRVQFVGAPRQRAEVADTAEDAGPASAPASPPARAPALGDEREAAPDSGDADNLPF
jgi:single-strand DNA-binding protein